MPSETFERFLSQLRATGSTKGDGFDRNHFDGLDAHERPEVGRLLYDALVAGDSTAAAGLVVFDRAAAPDALRRALERMPFENGAGANAAGELWLLTRDPRYQAELTRYLSHPGAGTPMVALSYLSQTPPAPSLAPALADFILREGNARRRSIAAGLYLYWLGQIPHLDDSYRLRRPFMEAVKNPDPATRRAALQQVGAAVA